MKVKSEREVAQSCPTLSDPMAPPSMGFSRQEYWSGVPLPSPNLRIDNYSKGKKKKWSQFMELKTRYLNKTI